MASSPPKTPASRKSSSIEVAGIEPTTSKKQQRRPLNGKNGTPRRPLSAYNLYFRSERGRICNDIKDGNPPEDFSRNVSKAMARAKGKDSVAQFQAIACTIAARWKELPKSERSEYEKLAEAEMEAYKERVSDSRCV